MALMPTLFVDDVEASSRWYQQLLGAKSAHGGPDFAAHKAAVAMGASIEGEPEFIDLAHHTEFVVLDPDGYALALFQPGQV